MLDKSQNVVSVCLTTIVNLLSFIVETIFIRKNSRSIMLDSPANILGNPLSSFLMQRFSELSICAALSSS